MITVHDKTYRKRIEEIKYYKEMYEFEVERNMKLLQDEKDLITQIDYYTKVYRIYKDRIDKAIEYIENKCLDDNYNYCFDLCGNDIFKVLDILKGSDTNGEN